jgi:hypothetical protein
MRVRMQNEEAGFGSSWKRAPDFDELLDERQQK